MAITIQSTPATYSSLQSDLIYTVAEAVHTIDPVTYPNYKFVGDVYVGAVLVARIKKVPDPVTKIGIFNIGQIVRNYITATLDPTTTLIVAQTMGTGVFSIAVTMKFGEEYAYTTYTNLTIDTARTFYNNYSKAGQTSNLVALLDKPLTNRPYATPVKRGSFNFIPFLPTTTSDYTLRIKTYDYSNTLVQQLNYAPGVPVAKQLHLINLSKDAINSVTPNMINDSIMYFTVQFDTPNISTDVTLRFDLTCESIYDVYTLHFLNQYGGFETKDFTKVSRKSIQIDKKDFGKLPYTVDAAGAVSYKNANNVYNESRSIYASQYKEKLTLNSDLLTDGEYLWLQQLILSPMVYIEDAGSFYPVVITENNYEIKRNVNDELTNLTISVEYGEQLNAQFR